jgi:DNA-directed RNA polymerase subunit M/transcription elongation factor TFIIS
MSIVEGDWNRCQKCGSILLTWYKKGVPYLWCKKCGTEHLQKAPQDSTLDELARKEA